MYLRKNQIKNLPETPGVYIYYRADTIIYVGKAVNLKNRIRSYFTNNLALKTSKMMSEAEKLDYIKVENELEALLLEAKLIRKYKPKYNITAKDDKHPLYIAITKEDFPRVIAIRKLMANNYSLMANFGPFPSSKNVYSVLRMLRRIFPYSDHKQGKRACLYSHMELCNPCPNLITNNQSSIVRQKLTKQYLKNISNLKRVLSGKSKKVLNDLYKEMNTLSAKQNFEEAAKIREQIRKLEYITQSKVPEDEFLKNPNLIEDIKNQEMQSLKKLLVTHGVDIKILKRIECFDVAHIAGSFPTASMVTFIDGESEKKFYRHFRIRQAKSQSDYDSMREVATRRLKNIVRWGKPDLIIVDGGVGQVNIFAKVFEKQKILIVAVAKHPDKLIFTSGTKVILNGDALKLVQKLRDEAHRFARRYHHRLLTKSLLTQNI